MKCIKKADQFIDNCEIPCTNQSSKLNTNSSELQSVQKVQSEKRMMKCRFVFSYIIYMFIWFI